ncbi:MAG: hypothetical protein KDC33_00935 [Thermoleophilia bacterium]|nr:hypothetical protein [Thermoleophilia bacterium]
MAAAPAVAYGLTAHALTTDNLPLEDRRAAGAVFGLLLLAGCALAARAAPAAEERVSRWEPRARGVRGACLAAALVMAVMPLGVLLTGSDVRDCRPTGIGGNVDRVTSLEGNQRGPWWCEAGRGWRLAPVAGNGAGSFPVIELRTRATGNGLVQTRDPHGMWPEAASALGTVGVALLALVWGLAGWALVRRRVPSALAAVPLAAFAQAQADWVMSWPAVAVPVGVAIGLIAGGPRAATRRRVAGEPARAAALAVGVVAVAAAAWLPYLAEHALVDGQDALYVRGDPGGAYRLASRAASLNPLAIEPAQLKGQALAAAGDRRGALNAFREATRVQPDNPASWQSLAQALPGDASASRAAWARVAELDPHSPALAARRGG